MRTRISIVAFALAMLTMLSCITSCNPATLCSGVPSGPTPINPNEEAKETTITLERKTDILDLDPNDATAPKEISFYLSVYGAPKLETIHGIFTVCDADGNFLCAINTPKEGWTHLTVPNQPGSNSDDRIMTIKGISSAVLNQLLCTHQTQLQITFEITDITFRSYDRYGEYEIVHATEMPPKITVKTDTMYDMEKGEKEYRLATKIFMDGGYGQALIAFEELIAKGKLTTKSEIYANRCREILGQ